MCRPRSRDHPIAAAAAPPGRDHHPELAKPHPAHVKLDLPDKLASGYRDQGALELPGRRQRLHIDRRLGSDTVTFLSDRGQEQSEGAAVTASRPGAR